MKILGTGLKGLVGSRLVELLSDKVEFEYSDVNISDEKSIKQKISQSSSEIVLHLAAKTNVDACELDKELGDQGETWKVNVLGTKYIAEECFHSNKKLMYISTDFVFDGENPPYTESSNPNPLNWYGMTKLEGEKAVSSQSGLSFIIARIAFPYRAKSERNDFFRAILQRLQENKVVNAVEDQIFCPTFIDDIGEALLKLAEEKQQGVFHVVGNQALSPYDAAQSIAKTFNLDHSLIQKTTRAEYFKNKAIRPFRLEIKNDKITELGIAMSTFEEGLAIIKQQL